MPPILWSPHTFEIKVWHCTICFTFCIYRIKVCSCYSLFTATIDMVAVSIKHDTHHMEQGARQAWRRCGCGPVHRWHDKLCSLTQLLGDKSKFYMCMGARAMMEGDKRDIALKLAHATGEISTWCALSSATCAEIESVQTACYCWCWLPFWLLAVNVGS